MDKTLLIIGHPETYIEFLDELLKLGYRGVVINKKVDEVYKEKNIKFIQCNLNDLQQVVKTAKELHAKYGFSGVFGHHEFNQYTIEIVSKELGLFHRNPEEVKAATHKYLMKCRFREFGIPTAKFDVIDMRLPFESEAIRIENSLSYPLVVKPINGIFSAGVRKVENRREMEKAVKVAVRITKVFESSSTDEFSRAHILVEEYIHGKEFNLDGFTINGQWSPMMNAEKFPDLHGPSFQENGLLFEKKNACFPNSFRQIAEKIVQAFPLPDSPFHIEVRRDETTGECFVVEFSPRLSGMGATIYNMMRGATGENVYEIFINQRLGKLNSLPEYEYKHCVLEYDTVSSMGGIIKQFKGLDQIRKMKGLYHIDLLKSIGDSISPPEYNIETVAVFYLKSADREEALAQMKRIDNTFKIEFE